MWVRTAVHRHAGSRKKLHLSARLLLEAYFISKNKDICVSEPSLMIHEQEISFLDARIYNWCFLLFVFFLLVPFLCCGALVIASA